MWVQLESDLDAARVAPRRSPVLAAALASAAPGRTGLPMVERTVFVDGKSQRLTLEAGVWNGLVELAERQGRSITELVEEIGLRRFGGDLSSATRLYVLDRFREAAAL